MIISAPTTSFHLRDYARTSSRLDARNDSRVTCGCQWQELHCRGRTGEGLQGVTALALSAMLLQEKRNGMKIMRVADLPGPYKTRLDHIQNLGQSDHCITVARSGRKLDGVEQQRGLRYLVKMPGVMPLLAAVIRKYRQE